MSRPEDAETIDPHHPAPPGPGPNLAQGEGYQSPCAAGARAPLMLLLRRIDGDREGLGGLLAAYGDRCCDEGEGRLRRIHRREGEAVALVCVAPEIPAVREDCNTAPIEWIGGGGSTRAGIAQAEVL